MWRGSGSKVPADQTSSYGIISGEEISDGVYRVSDMVEKPKPEDAPSNLAIIGRYIPARAHQAATSNTEPGKNGEVQITDALLKQAQSGCVLAYKFKGKRFDCGSVHGFVEATNFCYENYFLNSNS